MQGMKISQVGRIFALAAPSDSHGHRSSRRIKTKEERRVMIVSFVEKYKASNEGKFPPATLTLKEVGGTFYTVREILQELKQENVSCHTLGTDLEAIETTEQTRRVIEPLSVPEDSSKNGAVGNHHSLEHKEANYQETLSDTEEKKNVIHNDVLETCVNNKIPANEGRNIVGSPLGSKPTSLIVDSQPLQGLTKGQSTSSVINGAINSDHHLELSNALSNTEEQKNIVHNDVLEIHDSNGQTQAKQVINHGERPPRTSAASIAKNTECVVQGIKGDISSESNGVRDKSHSIALDEAEYLETLSLSDTQEQKSMIKNGVGRTSGQNDHSQGKQEIKIVERPQGTSVASVVGVQPLQEMVEGQSISCVTGGFMDKNHILEINEAKYQKALSDAEEKKNIIHNDVETCGLNDQTEVKQEIAILEKSPGTRAASNPLVTLEYREEGENHLHLETSKSLSLSSASHSATVTMHPEDLSFSVHHEDDNDLDLNSTNGIAKEPTIPADKIISPLTNSVAAPQEATEISNNILNSNYILEINDAKYQEALSDTEEKKNFIHNDMGTHSLNDQTQVKQEITIIEESPGTNALSNPLVALEYHGEGEEHLHLKISKSLSLSSDSHSTTCVTNQPKGVFVSVHDEDDNDLVINSTKEIAEESAVPADKLISSLTNSVTAPQEATGILDNVSDDQKLTALNISSDQVLTGVKAFYQVLLHRLALSALVIKTLIHAGDASQKDSREFQSENLDGYSHSKYCLDLSDKKETASVLSSLSLDQGTSTQDTMQSTQKTSSDGDFASNSVKKTSSFQEESTGDIMQISHDLSDGNCTALGNNERTYKNTKSSKDREKLETNMVSVFVNNILKGILFLLKK